MYGTIFGLRLMSDHSFTGNPKPLTASIGIMSGKGSDARTLLWAPVLAPLKTKELCLPMIRTSKMGDHHRESDMFYPLLL